MKIMELTAENVKRLTAVHITPDGAMVVIGGKNGQGKTSVLDSIMYALAGKGTMCEQPVHTGASKAKIVCRLDDLLVTRTITDEGGGTLSVTSPDGKLKHASPQKMLDELTGRLSFDPLEFQRMTPKAQLETLRGLVGLDSAAIDAQRKSLYDERTISGRDVTGRQAAIDAMPEYPDAPKAEIQPAQVDAAIVDTTAIASELQAAQAHNRKREAAAAAVQDTETAIGTCEAAIKQAKAEIAALQEVIDKQTSEHARLDAICKEQLAAVKAIAEIDTAPILAKLNAAEVTNRKNVADASAANREAAIEANSTNAKVRANAAKVAQRGVLAKAKAEYDRLTVQIDALDAQKAAMLAKAAFPVDGLGFGLDGVTFKSLPFSQASSAEQLRVSVAMGLVMNPKLKVLLIRDGSLLDEDSLQTVATMAETADAQVWIERVGEGAECSVIIEDGTVKAK